MRTMSQISVIVPIYNVEKYIHRCIDSILAQNFMDFELILIDDGSPDNCGKICDEYAKKDSRIHVIHKENGGLSDARNAGIDWAFEHSNSKWITFIDSDDWIHPKYLKALYNAVMNTGLNLSVCGFERTEGENPLVDESELMPEICNTESFYCEQNVNAIVAWGKLYKKEDFKTIRYPKGKLHEDEFTTYKILFKYKNVAFVNQPLYFYYQNENSITESRWTPKRLNQIEGKDNCACFLKNSCYKKAYLFCLKHLIYILVEQYNIVKSFPRKGRNRHLFYIKKHLRRTLRIHRPTPFSEYVYYYEIAYPLEMKVYWYWQVIKRKLKRK